MAKFTKANIKAIEGVRDAILANPTQYDQMHVCGTTCCIAGWAMRLHLGRPLEMTEAMDSVAEAAALFGLEYGEDDSPANKLFWSGAGEMWPQPYKSQFQRGEEVEAAASLLEAIVASDGQVLA